MREGQPLQTTVYPGRPHHVHSPFSASGPMMALHARQGTPDSRSSRRLFLRRSSAAGSGPCCRTSTGSGPCGVTATAGAGPCGSVAVDGDASSPIANGANLARTDASRAERLYCTVITDVSAAHHVARNADDCSTRIASGVRQDRTYFQFSSPFCVIHSVRCFAISLNTTARSRLTSST